MQRYDDADMMVDDDDGAGGDTQRQRKGRGFGDGDGGSRQRSQDIKYQESRPAASIEGYCIFVTNLNEECQDDDLLDEFGQFGAVKNIFMNLDRRSGFVKGYAILEYEHYEEAAAAIQAMHGATAFSKTIGVDWAFVKGPKDAGRGKPSRR